MKIDTDTMVEAQIVHIEKSISELESVQASKHFSVEMVQRLDEIKANLSWFRVAAVASRRRRGNV